MDRCFKRFAGLAEIVKSKSFAPLRSPRRSIARIIAGIVALVAVDLSFDAQAQTAQFSAAKSICLGNPASVNPNTCTHPPAVPVTAVAANTPLFYVFQVTGLPGSPTQNITISETAGPGNSGWPPGFIPSAIQCGSVVIPPTSTSMSFTLMQGQTVTCTAYGVFSPTTPLGSIVNTALVTSNQSPSQQIQKNVAFLQSQSLNTDLSITKSVSTPSVSVANGPALVTYTITIANNGNVGAPIAPYFMFHDTLALLPSSVPLNVTFMNATCSLSPNPSILTQCLTPPPTAVVNPLLVGTSAPHTFIDWSYPGSNGTIGPNDYITLKIQVRIDRIPGLNCKKLPGNPDGLANTGFFTLTTANSARYDTNSANNTDTANLSVDTGQTVVNSQCGEGQLKIVKHQTSPIASPVAWGPGPPASAGMVSYDIDITNTSLPAQTIVIQGGRLQDLVTEGVNTPPFTRTFIAASCTSPSMGVCPASSSFAGPAPTFTYSYYGQQNLAFQTGPSGAVTLHFGQTAHIHLTFRYSDPDCDSVPLANPKPIINTGKVTYFATPIGAPSGTQPIQFVQTADATTYMKPPAETCKFVVKKRLISGGPHVNFSPNSPPLVYQVSFTNNDAPRNIGTIMDMVRITDPAYASPLSFTASWQCSTPSSNPVVGFASTGNAPAGQAIYTNAPTQGAIVMVQPILATQLPLFFPHNSTLTCIIRIWVHRPAFNSPNCSSIPTDFENAAVMDTTRPYNPNGFWPISGAYNPAAVSNPNPQDRNWATVRTPLPKCFDVTINKSATVAGVSPPWTYVGGPPIDYTIAVTNPSNGLLSGSLSGSTWNGLIVADSFSPPYSGNLVLQGNVGPPSAPLCAPPSWCHSFINPPPTQQVGVASLASGVSGNWNISLQGPFTLGQVNNCATVQISGRFANLSDWYSNYNPSQPAPNGQNSCVSVPVVATTTIKIDKEIVNHTGVSINLPPLSFTAQVSCAPYPLQNIQTSNTFNIPGGPIANNGNVFSGGWGLQHVPVGDQCTVAEIPPPPLGLPRSPCQPGGTLEWTTTYSPLQPVTVQLSGTSIIIINELTCHYPPTGGVVVVKQFVNATGMAIAFPQQTFPVNVNCTGQPTTVLALQTPATTTTSSGAPGLVQNLPVGMYCAVTENTSALPFPAAAVKACSYQHGTPYWTTTITPAQPVTIVANTNVGVHVVNKIGCHIVPPPATLDLTKIFVDATGSPTPIGPLAFNVQINCTGMPATVVALQTPQTSTTSTSQTGTVSNISVSTPTSCTATEPGLTVPPTACVDPATGAQGVGNWTTTYIPAQTLTMVSGSNVLQVTNTLTCSYPQPLSSSLDVTKIFDDATGSPTPIGPLTFGVQALCGGTTTQLTPQTPATSTNSTAPVASVTNLPIGTQCTVSEPNLTFPPNACNYMSPPGIPNWTTTYLPSSTITTAAGSNAVQITNTLGCNVSPPQLGTLDITKIFVDATGSPVPIGPLGFGVQSLCGGATTVTTLQTAATATTSTSAMGQVANLPVGTTCTLSEPNLVYPPNACVNAGPPGTPSWTTTFVPSSTINIATGSNPVQVTNQLNCQYPSQTGTLDVTKVFIDGTGINSAIGPLTFGVQVVCGSTTTQLLPQTPATTSTSTAQVASVSNLPLNTTCTASEPSLTVPPGACVVPGVPPGNPYWITTYTPSGPITIGSGSNALQIDNKLQCTAGPGSLTVMKAVDWDGNLLAGHPAIFPIQVSCTLPNNTVMSQIINFNAPANGGYQQTISSLPVGTVCTVTELPPTYSSNANATFWGNMLSGYCNWHISYPFTQTVTIQAGNNVLQVANEQTCGPASTNTDITVQEEKTPVINGVVNFNPGVTFVINVSCTDPNNQPQSHNWIAASGSSAFNHHVTTPAGSTCSWSEAPPPLPVGANPQCYWQTLFFYNGSAVSGQSISIVMPPANAPFNWMNIQNQLVCPNGQVVVIQPVARMISPNGGGHNGGVKHGVPQCDRASSNGEQQGRCACPKDSKLKNGKCVKDKSALENILGHITIGVGVGVGGGSGKPKSGDTKPPQNGEQGR